MTLKRKHIVKYLKDVIQQQSNDKVYRYNFVCARPSWFRSVTEGINIDDAVCFQGKSREEILLKFINYLYKNFVHKGTDIDGEKYDLVGRIENEDNMTRNELCEMNVENMMINYGLIKNDSFMVMACDVHLKRVKIL